MKLDTAYIMSEITAGDSLLTPRDIIEQLIANDEDDLLTDMLDNFYQTHSDKVCQPIDNAIEQLYKNYMESYAA